MFGKKTRARSFGLVLGALFGLALNACDAAPVDVAPVGEVTHPDAWAHAAPTGPTPTALLPGSIVGEGRRARRMSVEQLRRSIEALFDGITWTVTARGPALPGFDVLSATLGEADYIRTTQNNLDPSPLFAKFMDDMAASVCRQAVDRDVAGRTLKLVIAREDVTDNLRFLRLKLHGIHVPEGSAEGLEALADLHAEILSATHDEAEAWWGVCIAMLTAPEMLAY